MHIKFYLTPKQIFKFATIYSPLCFCQQGYNVTCPIAKKLWFRVYSLIHPVTGYNIQRDPVETLIFKPVANIPKKYVKWMFLSTKLTIVQSWKASRLQL